MEDLPAEVVEGVVRPELMETVLCRELVERILAVMPRDEAIRAGLVCQGWHKIVSSPSFGKLCSRTLSACDKICFPAFFSRSLQQPGLGLDMERQNWHQLPSLSISSISLCLASHKGLLFLGSHWAADGRYWVTNPVTGAVRELPSFQPLIEIDKQLYGYETSNPSSGFMEVDADGQSYALLAVCKRITGLGSRAAGPARIVRYRSGSSSWTLLPSRCQEEALGIHLPLCDLCSNLVFSDGQVFGLARVCRPEFRFFLVSFHVEAMTWECVCEVKLDSHVPKGVVVCNSCIMVVAQSWGDQPLIVVMTYDPAKKRMVLETQLPTMYSYRGLGNCSAHGPVLCIMALVVHDHTTFFKAAYMATYNARTKKWHKESSREWEWNPWTLVPAVFELGLCLKGVFTPCAFELGLSTPV